jgi:hypothetical protein
MVPLSTALYSEQNVGKEWVFKGCLQCTNYQVPCYCLLYFDVIKDELILKLTYM